VIQCMKIDLSRLVDTVSSAMAYKNLCLKLNLECSLGNPPNYFVISVEVYPLGVVSNKQILLFKSC